MSPECVKCGARMVGPQFVRERGREFLRYVCTCGHTMATPTRDAKNAKAENALRGDTSEPTP